MSRTALTICILLLFPLCGFSQEKLEIVAAHYGDLPDGKKVDVTAKLLELVKENALRVEASNDLFGDPVEQVAKKLRVRYRKGGTMEEVIVAEGETLLIPVPKLAGELVIHKAVYGDLPQAPPTK